MDIMRGSADLAARLTGALELADVLGLPLVAIHIEEARARLSLDLAMGTIGDLAEAC